MLAGSLLRRVVEYLGVEAGDPILCLDGLRGVHSFGIEWG